MSGLQFGLHAAGDLAGVSGGADFCQVSGLLSCAGKLVGQLAGRWSYENEIRSSCSAEVFGDGCCFAGSAEGDVWRGRMTLRWRRLRRGRSAGWWMEGINVFKGVPYGGDTAKTRFMAPVAPVPWTGVKDCAALRRWLRSWWRRGLGAGRLVRGCGCAAGRLRRRLRRLRLRGCRGRRGTRGCRVRIVCT